MSILHMTVRYPEPLPQSLKALGLLHRVAHFQSFWEFYMFRKKFCNTQSSFLLGQAILQCSEEVFIKSGLSQPTYRRIIPGNICRPQTGYRYDECTRAALWQFWTSSEIARKMLEEACKVLQGPWSIPLTCVLYGILCRAVVNNENTARALRDCFNHQGNAYPPTRQHLAPVLRILMFAELCNQQEADYPFGKMQH